MDQGCWLGPPHRGVTGQMVREQIPLSSHTCPIYTEWEGRKRLCPIAALFPRPLNQGEAFEGEGQSVGGRLCLLAAQLE